MMACDYYHSRKVKRPARNASSIAVSFFRVFKRARSATLSLWSHAREKQRESMLCRGLAREKPTTPRIV